MEDNTIQGGAIFNAVKQAEGLFSNVNKAKSSDGLVAEDVKDEYTSSFTDEQVTTLVTAWKKDYDTYYPDIKKVQEKSTQYWLGKQKVDMVDTIEGKDTVVNKLFEAIETFLPIATRSNPEPLVSSDNTDEGQTLAKELKEVLAYQADTQKLRRKLAKMTRQWMIYLIGAIEVEYDSEVDDIKTSVINPQRFTFDKDGYIDESGFFIGEYFGIDCKMTASKLAVMFPKHKGYIMNAAGGKGGTKITYTKWWYRNTEVFFTLGTKKCLGKFKNPHWNYDGEEQRTDAETGQTMVEQVIGRNHLLKPTAPYVFLSIFSLGKQPHDETSLVLQNIPQQDNINKRYRQLDRNIDGQNNGIIVDGRIMTQEQAAEAAGAKRRGAAIRVMGDVNTAIKFDGPPQLPSDVWESVNKSEQNLANIFGTSGSTPSGIKSEESARGKIMISQMDASRIGGGITEYIEQAADTVYNLWVQMMYVHYDTEHYFNILGSEEGNELVSLYNGRFNKSITVTVKEGSLIPKDPLTQRNEAVDLWSQNAIDPLTLYKKLDFPDPTAATEALIKWQMLGKGMIEPQMYLPSFRIQAPQAPLPGEQPGTGGPAVNPMTGQEAPIPAPDAPSNEAGAVQSKQLLQSVPLQ